MAVYCKFKSEKVFYLIPIEGKFISVCDLKRKIFASMYKTSGRIPFDKLIISNAQTDEEHTDEAALIPEWTSVLIRRMPRWSGLPIIIEASKKKIIEEKVEDNRSGSTLDEYVSDHGIDFDDFGDDVYAIPGPKPAQSSNPTVAVASDEEERNKALVRTPARYLKSEAHDFYGYGSCWRGTDRRMMTSYYVGRGGMEMKTPPAGYVCHRCGVPGHFIHHCPTNGNSTYDIKKMELPSTPKAMLKSNPEGIHAMSCDNVAVMKPNEVALKKELAVSSSTRSGCDFPPELCCPLCRHIMRDAMFTRSCCLRSFCATCIRDYVLPKSACICGATDMKVDDLIPNRTVRETIARLESSTCSSIVTSVSLGQLKGSDAVSTHPLQFATPDIVIKVSKDEHRSLKQKTTKRSLNLSEGGVSMSAPTSQSGDSLPEEVQAKTKKIKKKHQPVESHNWASAKGYGSSKPDRKDWF